MPTPPTPVSSGATAWNSGSSPKTLSPSVQTGDVIVVGFMTGNQDKATISSSPSLTWTARQDITAGSNSSSATMWTATATATGTLTITLTDGGAPGVWGGLYWVVRGAGSEYDSGGKVNINTGSGAPNVTFTTLTANCLICCMDVDWNSADGTSRVWRTVNGITPTAANGGEDNYYRDTTNYATYGAHYTDSGAAGSVSPGLSAPAQRYTAMAVAIPGTSSGGSTASGSLALSGSAVASTSASAAVSVSATAIQSDTASGTLALSGSATGGPTATGSLSLSGTAHGNESASGSLSLSAAASHSESTSGSITLGGTQGSDYVISQPSNGGSSYTYGGAFVDQIAQTFTAPADMNVFQATAGLAKTGLPTDNWYFTIAPDSSGSPGTVIGTSDNVAASGVPTSVSDVTFTFSTQVGLTSGTVYWLILNRSGSADSVNTMLWYYGSGYAGGSAATKSGSFWTAQSPDMEFSVTGHKPSGPSASGSFALSGSAVWSGTSASGAITLGGSAAESSVATASIALAGAGTSSRSASGSVALGGAAGTYNAAAGSISLAGATTGTANASATGAITFSGVQSSGPSGAGSITLATTATTRANGGGAGSLALAGVASIGGSSASAAVTLSATTTVREVASGTVTLGASGGWKVTVTGSVTLTGAGGAVAKATTTATLDLAASAFVGVVRNYIHGAASLGRGGGATVKASGSAKIGSGSGGASIP